MYVRSDPHSEVEREANGAADDAAEPVGDLHAFRMKQKREVLLFWCGGAMVKGGGSRA